MTREQSIIATEIRNESRKLKFKGYDPSLADMMASGVESEIEAKREQAFVECRAVLAQLKDGGRLIPLARAVYEGISKDSRVFVVRYQ